MNKSVFRFLSISILAAALVFSPHCIVRLNNTVSAQAVVQLIPVLTGLQTPVYVTNARDGSNRLFILEKAGRIRLRLPGDAAPLPTPFLDISTKVSTEGESGLLGLTFHPRYKTNRRFFVSYSRQADGATIVSEFKASIDAPNVADAEERVILAIRKQHPTHNGGWMDFGPDGCLYISTGDGGGGDDPHNRAQNIDELQGKILRIDVNTDGATPYRSPETNPFFNSGSGRNEIYALGFRNPWRCSFDRATGEFYAGDVGQGFIEEIDIVTLGGNYGWRVFEGTRCTDLDHDFCVESNYIAPLIEYDHFTNGRCSVIGGYVYRGERGSLPKGGYVFGDFCSGEIFLWNGRSMSLMLDSNLLISSFGEDESGEIYVVSLGGAIHRIAAAPAATSVSAASYRGSQLAPESIAAGFGENFAATTQTATGEPLLPTTLAGASVTVTDAAGTSRLAPLFFVSPNQINFQIPQGAELGEAAIAFTNTNGAISGGIVSLVNVAPGLFTANSSGSGIASALVLRVKSGGSHAFEPIVQLNAQNQFVAIPIDFGAATDQVFLVAFGVGFRFRSSLSAVTASIGGTPAQVTFAGAQPNFVGLDQANIQLPRSLAGRGEVDVVFTVDGQTANTVKITIATNARGPN